VLKKGSLRSFTEKKEYWVLKKVNGKDGKGEAKGAKKKQLHK
jgi:hypothetical protein